MSGFEEFRKQYAASRIPAPPITDETLLNKYKNRLPDSLFEEWRISGLCGFADGFIWLIDPATVEFAMVQWKIDPPSLAFGRTAFGDLFLWDGESVRCLFVHDGTLEWLSGDFDMFFEYALTDQAFLDEVLRFPMFLQALAKLGPVAADEMYTFVPALVLGGADDVDHLKKVKMREQLLFLAQAHGGARHS